MWANFLTLFVAKYDHLVVAAVAAVVAAQCVGGLNDVEVYDPLLKPTWT